MILRIRTAGRWNFAVQLRFRRLLPEFLGMFPDLLSELLPGILGIFARRRQNNVRRRWTIRTRVKNERTFPWLRINSVGAKCIPFGLRNRRRRRRSSSRIASGIDERQRGRSRRMLRFFAGSSARRIQRSDLIRLRSFQQMNMLQHHRYQWKIKRSQSRLFFLKKKRKRFSFRKIFELILENLKIRNAEISSKFRIWISW